jgi:biopolymer transport protein ExbD
MGYLVQGGAPPDASVSTDKIVDDAVTLAKMAAGTDGNIISYDASGNPVAVATGTDGQVLTSSGAGAVCAFEDAAGGAWTLISSVAASDNSSIDFTSGIDASTNDVFLLEFTAVIPATTATNLLIEVSSNGTTFFGACDGHLSNLATNSTSYAAVNPTTATLFNSMWNSSSKGVSGDVIIHADAETTYKQFVYLRSAAEDSGGDKRGFSGFQRLNGISATLTGLRIISSSGNITSGTFSLYKLAKA